MKIIIIFVTKWNSFLQLGKIFTLNNSKCRGLKKDKEAKKRAINYVPRHVTTVLLWV